ncbi:MAG: hypothetical protein ACJA0Q_001839 [Saprospiraceae bacterium]|jgi:hypothetical protein
MNQQLKQTGKMEASIKLIDASFDKNNLANYHLSIQLHEFSITVCVTDLKLNTAVAVWNINSKYRIFNENDTDELLNNLLKKCTLPLKGDYKKTSVAIANNQYSFIPNPLFDSSLLAHYVELNCGPTANSEFKQDEVDHENLKIVYAIPTSVIKLLEKTLESFELTHHQKVFLNAVNSDFKANDSELYVNYQHKQLTLLYFNDGKFHHGSTHEIGTPEDFLFFVLNTCEQLGLNPQKIKLVLLGEIKTGDEIHHLAFSYFEKIQFGAVQKKLNTAPALNDVPKHYFYTAYKQYLCE